jgi:hypothetical protein
LKATQLNVKGYELAKLDNPPGAYIRVAVEYLIPFNLEIIPKVETSFGVKVNFDTDCLKRYASHIDDFIKTEESIALSSTDR